MAVIPVKKHPSRFDHVMAALILKCFPQGQRKLCRCGRGNQQHDIIGCVCQRCNEVLFFFFSHFSHRRAVTAELVITDKQP